MDKITLDQVKTTVAEVVAENPNLVNPRLGGARGCAYTKPYSDTTPNAAEHCIGGTVLLKLGLSLPGEGTTVRASSDADKFEEVALNYLRAVQYAADGFEHGGIRPSASPTTWSQALEIGNREFNSDEWNYV